MIPNKIKITIAGAGCVGKTIIGLFVQKTLSDKGFNVSYDDHELKPMHRLKRLREIDKCLSSIQGVDIEIVERHRRLTER